MKILLCCESFSPNTGGVQKMMHEIGMQFVSFGHNVSVATTWNESRDFIEIDGLRIHSFKVQGNSSKGLIGEVGKYQDFLINGDYDCLLVMAAQQWTLDAMLPVLNEIKYIKLHIPCGYSGFFQKKYSHYYNEMKSYLSGFDHLIYNASDYRDINFARNLGLNDKINIIPAGASEAEFGQNPKLNIKNKLGIMDKDFIFLSVGNPPYLKGHREIIKAYNKAELSGDSVLVLNGAYEKHSQHFSKEWFKDILRRALGRAPSSIKKLAKNIRANNKRVIFIDLNRNEIVSLFYESDLFVFASYVEYSPLVIYECLAAGLPFLTVPVGNTQEIISNSNGGVICGAQINQEGFTKVEPLLLAQEMEKLYINKTKLHELHINGRIAWEQKYTWNKIARQIEKLFT